MASTLIFVLLWLFSVIFLLLLHSFFSKPKNPTRRSLRLPPSPPCLPVIGHLHHLLSVPFFKSFQKLSSKYGPLLYLSVFNFRMVIVSSASVAHDVYKTNDVNFSSRYPCTVDDSILAGRYGFFTASYGDYWRFMKKIVVTELLGQQHIQRTHSLRSEELRRFFVKMLEKAKRNEAVDVGKEMMKLSNNIICKMAMGTLCSEEDGEAERVRALVKETIGLTNKVVVAIALNWLKRFGVSLFEKDVMNVSNRYDELLEKILKEHEENPDREHKDMMDVLLEAYHDEKAEYKITRTHIKSFLVDLFVAGTDTSSQATQWTMAELVNRPSVFKKLREEIDGVMGKTRLIRETDLPSLPYLQAIVKEGLRLHPPAAVMARKCDEGCVVGGFDVPKDTLLLVNHYAVMRDPDAWENPDEFCPERFLVSSSSKGREAAERDKALRYIPFGVGRRACPGANLAYAIVGTSVGAMVQCFDWRIGRGGERVNMEEAGDMALNMAHPLKITPVLRFNPMA